MKTNRPTKRLRSITSDEWEWFVNEYKSAFRYYNEKKRKRLPLKKEHIRIFADLIWREIDREYKNTHVI